MAYSASTSVHNGGTIHPHTASTRKRDPTARPQRARIDLMPDDWEAESSIIGLDCIYPIYSHPRHNALHSIHTPGNVISYKCKYYATL